MRLALPKRMMRWFFILLIGFLLISASHLPVAAAKIAFQSSRDFADFEFKYNIYVMDTDGKNLVRLTQGPASDANPAWSPDGTQIAFKSNRKGSLGIYVMDADGSNEIALAENLKVAIEPVWSPKPLAVSARGRLSTVWGTLKSKQ